MERVFFAAFSVLGDQMRRLIKRYVRLYRAGGLKQVLALHDARRAGLQRVCLTIHGQRIWVRVDAPDVGVAINNLGDEFKPLADLAQLNNCRLVIDAGGFIGTAALALAGLFPQARIISIEPSPENFSLLEENTRHHPRIERIQAALVSSRSPGVARLRDRGTGQWGFSITPSTTQDKSIEVQTVSISEILEAHGNAGAVLCKMDIEGGEYALLQEAETWLDRCDVLAIELHERIVAGTEDLFVRTNARRSVHKMSSDKFLSIR